MKLPQIFLVIIGLSFFSVSVLGQVKISKTYQNDSFDLFSSEKYENAITRQHSITINLKNFIFAEVRDGDYLLSLRIRFLKYILGSGQPIIKSEINTVFYDNQLIRTYQEVEIKDENSKKKKKKKRKKQYIELSLKDKLLTFNHKLIDISHIEITVRMTKVKDEYASTIQTLKPILNVAVNSLETVKLVENILDNIQSDEVKAPLLFSGEIYIPANIFEYEQNAEKRYSRIVDNNEEFAIILKGNTPINDNSLKGKSVEIINRVTKFIYGKEELKKEDVKMNGLITLYFTKDNKPVIPITIVDKLNKIDGYLSEYNLKNIKSELDANIKETFKIIEFAQNAETITPNTYYDVNQYLKLAQFYYLFVAADNVENAENSCEIKGNLVRSYKRWYDQINLKGAANDVQAIGIKGIYSDARIAKIFIPSGLSDFNTMSFYLWQKAIHEILAENNKNKLAQRETFLDTP